MFTCGLWAVLGIGFIFAMTSLGSAAVFLFLAGHSFALQRVTMGFSAGIMTAASVWSLLLPAIAQAEADLLAPPWMPAAFGLLLGAFFLAGLELMQRRGEGERRSLLFAAVTLHNIPEGMAVGAILAGLLSGEKGVTLAGAMMLSLGIALQNIPEGTIISMPLCAGGMKKGKAAMYGLWSGLVEPLSAMLTIWATELIVPILPYLLSFAAGTMIYVVASELIPEIHEGEGKKKALLWLGLGFSIMMSLDVALG